MSVAARYQRARRKLLRNDRVLVGPVMNLLDTGKPTKFAYEGAVRAGLRAAFCLNGEPWPWADVRAELLTTEALVRLHAVRPTYAEGQREWTDPGYAPGDIYFCHRCKRPMPEDRGLGAKFCSDQCKTAAYLAGARAHRAQMRRVEWRAMMIVRRAQKLEDHGLTCRQCGNKFLMFDKAKDIRDSEKYCSRACRKAACTARPCARCGTPFQPKKNAGARFCSEACASRARNIRWRQRQREAEAQNAIKADEMGTFREDHIPRGGNTWEPGISAWSCK